MVTTRDLLTGYLLHELADRIGYRWEPDTARYRNLNTGRFVSESRVISTIEQYNETALRSNIRDLTERLIDGRIDLPTWQQRMRTEIKDAHLINAMAGRGGRNAMTQADFGRTGGRLRFEYQQLDMFAQEIAAGQLSEAQILARAQQYTNAPRKGYYDGKTAAQAVAGFTEERRVLNPAEHCSDCIGYAAQGWQPIGTLPEPGEGSVCLSNCKCNKEYR